jgi:hypothetical protein
VHYHYAVLLGHSIVMCARSSLITGASGSDLMRGMVCPCMGGARVTGVALY